MLELHISVLLESMTVFAMEVFLNNIHRFVRKKYITFVRTKLNQGKVITLNDISVLHKDEDYVFVNKSYDIAINGIYQPDGTVEHEKLNVAVQLEKLYPHLVCKDLVNKFRNVHRLDYATSGVYCVALNKKASAKASKAFQKRQTIKHYLALVRGHVPMEYRDSLNISVGIAKDDREGWRHRMCVDGEEYSIQPRTASTNLVLLEHGSYSGQPASKVLLIPITGRRHQLRVHCSYMGHTIVGDYTYSDRTDVKPYRMMLHAHRLILPLKHKTYDVTAPDLFVPSIDKKWRPDTVFRTYDKEMFY